MNFGKKNGIELESSQCQVIISGSGEGGVPRYNPDDPAKKKKDQDNENKSARRTRDKSNPTPKRGDQKSNPR